ncbi:hypothetical protein BMS3Abin11_02413 [bacterium BMS3Abin11]|nr:hypothetical protein BMS3Abin11_02413 [bacterium BMS3Abin11]
MEIAFSTKMLRDICESEVLAYQMFDADTAKSLIARLADLRAVDKVSQIPVGNPESIDRDGEKCIKIELARKELMIICANHSNNPMLSNNEVEWDKVSRIKICSIGEYDG